MREQAQGSGKARLARWAAILLPIVVLARAVLLVFQIGDERQERAHANDPPPWPPVAGEELRFRSDNPHIAGWVSDPDRPRLLVPITERDYLPVDPGVGCVLDPAALVRHHGALTLRSRTPTGDWRATWSGGATAATSDEAPMDQADPHLRDVEANLLRAVNCGGEARVELRSWEVHVLVNLLAGNPLPPRPDPPPPPRELHIPVDGPPP